MLKKSGAGDLHPDIDQEARATDASSWITPAWIGHIPDARQANFSMDEQGRGWISGSSMRPLTEIYAWWPGRLWRGGIVVIACSSSCSAAGDCVGILLLPPTAW